MRVNRIEHARKPQTCQRCRDKITKGQPYLWAKGRYGPKMVRCTKHECRFRPTDLSSAKTARIEEAIEDAQDTIGGAESLDDIQAAMQEVADVAQEVADEYQEASDQWAGGNGHEEFQEKADACSSFADECSGWTFSGEEDEDAVRSAAGEDLERDTGERLEDFQNRQAEAGDEAWDQTVQGMRDEAEGVLDSFSV